ncbi:MAG: RagB/SusD family nutrient uptake outer membrane protein [Chitinophagaceae bacterium]|nr:RagB/SusD family nutrient uptake outer membrane protein [Chitinophagaceae bacterium]
MKIVNIIITSFLGMVLLFFTACSKKLDVIPQYQINDQQIKDLLASGDPVQQQKILGGMANSMPLLFNKAGITGMGVADYAYYTNQSIGIMRDLEGNDMVLGETQISDNLAGANEYNLINIPGAANERLNTAYWFYPWELITKANQLLAYLSDEIVASSNLMKEYKARALVVRSYAYNYLMENYQDAYMKGGNTKQGMPLYTTYNPFQTLKARSSAEETYTLIKSDINDAVQLLQTAGVGYTTGTDDIDMGVANFVKARIALVTGDYPTVISATNDILSHYPDLLQEDHYGAKNSGTPGDPEFLSIDNGFLYNSVNPEIILGFNLGVAVNYINNLMNTFGEGYGGVIEAYKRIDERLYNKIADDDFRKDTYQGATAFGNFTYPSNGIMRTLPSYINFKYAASKGLDGDKLKANQSDTYYMRASEVLLMKAEAQAAGSNPSDALVTLNQLLAARTRSGAPVLTTSNYPAMAGMSPLEMVQFQTRVELWGEGREFYNNKRWGIPVDRSSSTNHINKGQLSVADMTIQIPNDEMLHNPLSTQN